MPTRLDTHLLVVIALAALVVWRLQARIRRLLKRQRLSKIRPWITLVVFPLVFVLLLATSLGHPVAGAAALAGAVVGAGLGVLGTRLTKFEATSAGLFYTPNAHLGIALSLLFVVRLAWRFVVLQAGGRSLAAPVTPLGANPLTLAIFGALAGYYVAYAVGLLRWRARVGLQETAEH